MTKVIQINVNGSEYEVYAMCNMRGGDYFHLHVEKNDRPIMLDIKEINRKFLEHELLKYYKFSSNNLNAKIHCNIARWYAHDTTRLGIKRGEFYGSKFDGVEYAENEIDDDYLSMILESKLIERYTKPRIVANKERDFDMARLLLKWNAPENLLLGNLGDLYLVYKLELPRIEMEKMQAFKKYGLID